MTDFRDYKKISFDSPSRIRQVQEKLLADHLTYLTENSPYYKKALVGLDIKQADHFPLNRLAELPFTSKQDLGKYNRDFVAVNEEMIADIVFSSGTTGSPTRIIYTEQDLNRLAYNEHQSLASAGITANDRALLTCTMDRCFIAGLAYFLGLRSLGAATVRNGHGTLAGHGEIINRVAPSVLIGVPSFLVKLGGYLKSLGEDPRRSSIQTLICIGEPVRDGTLNNLPAANALETLWKANIHSTYASSETVSTFCECTSRQGGHLHPELAIVEIINKKGEPLPAGETGEITVTPLATEGMPLLRFRTGDIGFLINEPCACGRNSARLSPILGRRDQMLKINGTTVYPNSIGRILDSIPDVEEHFVEVYTRDHLSDRIIVYAAIHGDNWTAESLAEKLQATLRVKPRVVIEPERMIKGRVFSPENRKPVRFFDYRSK